MNENTIDPLSLRHGETDFREHRERLIRALTIHLLDNPTLNQFPILAIDRYHRQIALRFLHNVYEFDVSATHLKIHSLTRDGAELPDTDHTKNMPIGFDDQIYWIYPIGSYLRFTDGNLHPLNVEPDVRYRLGNLNRRKDFELIPIEEDSP